MVGMGEMTEGRKCVECLGRRFSQRYALNTFAEAFLLEAHVKLIIYQEHATNSHISFALCSKQNCTRRITYHITLCPIIWFEALFVTSIIMTNC